MARISIERELATKGGAKVEIGIVGNTALFSFVMAAGPMSGMEIVCVRGKRAAARVRDALRAHDAADFWPLRHAAFAAKASQ